MQFVLNVAACHLNEVEMRLKLSLTKTANVLKICSFGWCQKSGKLMTANPKLTSEFHDLSRFLLTFRSLFLILDEF